MYLGLNRLGRGGGALIEAGVLMGAALSELDLQGNGLSRLPDEVGWIDEGRLMGRGREGGRGSGQW